MRLELRKQRLEGPSRQGCTVLRLPPSRGDGKGLGEGCPPAAGVGVGGTSAGTWIQGPHGFQDEGTPFFLVPI